MHGLRRSSMCPLKDFSDLDHPNLWSFLVILLTLDITLLTTSTRLQQILKKPQPPPRSYRFASFAEVLNATTKEHPILRHCFRFPDMETTLGATKLVAYAWWGIDQDLASAAVVATGHCTGVDSRYGSGEVGRGGALWNQRMWPQAWSPDLWQGHWSRV